MLARCMRRNAVVTRFCRDAGRTACLRQRTDSGLVEGRGGSAKAQNVCVACAEMARYACTRVVEMLEAWHGGVARKAAIDPKPPIFCTTKRVETVRKSEMLRWRSIVYQCHAPRARCPSCGNGKEAMSEETGDKARGEVYSRQRVPPRRGVPERRGPDSI